MNIFNQQRVILQPTRTDNLALHHEVTIMGETKPVTDGHLSSYLRHQVYPSLVLVWHKDGHATLMNTHGEVNCTCASANCEHWQLCVALLPVEEKEAYTNRRNDDEDEDEKDTNVPPALTDKRGPNEQALGPLLQDAQKKWLETRATGKTLKSAFEALSENAKNQDHASQELEVAKQVKAVKHSSQELVEVTNKILADQTIQLGSPVISMRMRQFVRDGVVIPVERLFEVNEYIDA